MAPLLESRTPAAPLPRPRPAQSGTALIEFALILPLLLLLLLAGMDLGRVYYCAMAATQAARAGVQYGAASVARSMDLAGIEQAARDAAHDIGTITTSADRLCQCSDGTAVDCSTGNCGTEGRPQVFVRLTVQTTFRSLVHYPGLPESVAVSRTAQMRVQ